MEKEFEELRDQIEHRIRSVVEDHPLTRRLPRVAIRNMAYCGSHGAIDALTADQIKSCANLPNVS